MELLVIGSGIQSIQFWIASLGVSEAMAFWLTAAICVAGASLVTVGLMALMWKYRRALTRDRDLKLARFTAPGIPGISLFNALRIPTPKFSFDLSGMKGVGTSLAIVGVAFVVAFTFVVASTDDTPVWPEAGAAYALPNVHGVSLEPDPENPADQNQTLQINLAAGVRLTTLTLNNLDLGKAGLTDCVTISTKLRIIGIINSRVRNSVPESVVEDLFFRRSISTLACISCSVTSGCSATRYSLRPYLLPVSYFMNSNNSAWVAESSSILARSASIVAWRVSLAAISITACTSSASRAVSSSAVN